MAHPFEPREGPASVRGSSRKETLGSGISLDRFGEDLLPLNVRVRRAKMRVFFELVPMPVCAQMFDLIFASLETGLKNDGLSMRVPILSHPGGRGKSKDIRGP